MSLAGFFSHVRCALAIIVVGAGVTGSPLPLAAEPMPCPMCDRLNTDHPLAFFWRQAELPMPYDPWEATFSRLSGFAGKALNDDFPNSTDNIPRFAQFKREHPEQLVLLHFSGNARSPRFPMPGAFPGHWLHRPGSRVLDEVPATAGRTLLRLADVSRLQTNMGLYCNRNDDISLCALRAGRPNWSVCEQTKLISVDRETRSIVVQRAQYGSPPRSFAAGQAYAAAHFTIGPWRRDGDLLWLYNYSTLSPVSPAGTRAYEVLADELAARFRPSGALAAFDGVIFDNMQWDRPRADYDGDGLPDDAMADGVNTYGLGMVRFLERLRTALPDKLLLADGMLENTQRGFGVLNGMESEGFPVLYDHDLDDWSGGINRVVYWRTVSRRPVLNFLNHKFENTFVPCRGTPGHAARPWNIHRLTLSAAPLTDAAFTYTAAPPSEPGETIGIWDELVSGADRRKGWLGRALAPAQLLAASKPNLLADGDGIGAALAARFEGVNARISRQGSTLRVASTTAAAPQTVVFLRELAVRGPDVLLTLRASSDPLPGLPPRIARLLKVNLVRSAGAAGALPEQTIFTWLGSTPITSQFYFRGVAASRVDVRLEFEGPAEAQLYEIAAYEHPAAMVREFEHGVVLANPADHPYRFDLAALFPGQVYRRILASSAQDRTTNDGTPVGGTVTLPRRDALFLVRTQ